MKYLIGQRVILNNKEIGTIVKPDNKDLPNTNNDIWVYSPSRGYASRYDTINIKPLTNNQL